MKSRMVHSRSQAVIKSGLDRTPNSRTFYINKELSNSKDVATTFHSPYKDGKKNINFTNPTFLSSNLFYADEEVQK